MESKDGTYTIVRLGEANYKAFIPIELGKNPPVSLDIKLVNPDERTIRKGGVRRSV